MQPMHLDITSRSDPAYAARLRFRFERDDTFWALSDQSEPSIIREIPFSIKRLARRFAPGFGACSVEI
jgi:hypothetical protein